MDLSFYEELLETATLRAAVDSDSPPEGLERALEALLSQTLSFPPVERFALRALLTAAARRLKDKFSLDAAKLLPSLPLGAFSISGDTGVVLTRLAAPEVPPLQALCPPDPEHAIPPLAFPPSFLAASCPRT